MRPVCRYAYTAAMNTPLERHPDSEIIDRLGGTVEVAKICEIKPPSVSEWRVTGIPQARRQFLSLLRPEAFKPAKKAKA